MRLIRLSAPLAIAVMTGWMWSIVPDDACAADPDGSSMTITGQRDYPYHQYSLSERSPISPYIAFGEVHRDTVTNDFFREDFANAPDERYAHEHSYLQQQPAYQRKAWAGLKLRLNELLNMEIDPQQRNIRSTLNLAPKTTMKFRVKFNGIRADVVYRF